MSWYTLDEMREIMKEIPPSDPQMQEDIYYYAIDNGYLIYDSKANKAACTRCGYVWDIAPGEYAGTHGLKDVCPCCESTLICLSAGRGRASRTEYHRLLSFAEKEGTLWAVLNDITVMFDNFGRPDLYRTPTAVYKMNGKEQRYWKRMSCWYHEDYYTEPGNIRVPNPPGTIYGCSKYTDHVYLPGLEKTVKKTDARYLWEQEYSDANMNIVSRIAVQLKYPSVEKLRKAGFKRLANIKISGMGSRCINWRGDSLEKILKLPKRWVKYLRPLDPSEKMLRLFQHMTEEERQQTPLRVLYDMADSYRSEDVYRAKVAEYMPFKKWCRYIAGQPEQIRAKGYWLTDYEDYIRMATALGMDITKNSIRFPADMRKAHDELTDRYHAMKEAERKKAEEEAVKQLAARMDHVKEITGNAVKAAHLPDDLMIRPAFTQEDLNKESAKLCHCVKTYTRKIALGKCWIFFIRKSEDPNEPYYTLETTTEGKMVQCRGSHNCGMTDEVQTFVDSFTRTLQKQIRKGEKLCQTA